MGGTEARTGFGKNIACSRDVTRRYMLHRY